MNESVTEGFSVANSAPKTKTESPVNLPTEQTTNNTAPSQNNSEFFLSEFSSPQLTEDLAVEMTRAFVAKQGNLQELLANPNLSDKNKELVRKAVQKIDQDKAQLSAKTEVFFQQIQNLESVDEKLLESQMREYQTLGGFAGEMLSEQQKKALKPEILQSFQKVESKLTQELLVRADSVGLDFLEKVISKTLNDPDAPPELKADAMDMAKNLIEDAGQKMKGIEGSEKGLEELNNLAKRLGISDKLNFEQKQQEIVGDLATAVPSDGKIDVLQIFGLKDQQGNVIKGKATLLASIMMLVVFSDQLLARASGSTGILPLILNVINSTTQGFVQHAELARLKEKDPNLYAYYKHKYPANFLIEFVFNHYKSSSPVTRAA